MSAFTAEASYTTVMMHYPEGTNMAAENFLDQGLFQIDSGPANIDCHILSINANHLAQLAEISDNENKVTKSSPNDPVETNLMSSAANTDS
jgi:hypothetical protein